MTGVIRKDQNDFPIYQSTPLNSSTNQKCLGIIVLIIYIMTIVLAFIGWFYSYISLSDERIILCLLLHVQFPIFEIITSIIIVCVVNRNCCVKQTVDCSENINLHLFCSMQMCMCVIIGVLVCYLRSYIQGGFTWDIIGVASVEITTFIWTIIALIVHKNSCKCKKCNKIKDVIIWYQTRSYELAETDKVTKESLMKKFEIALAKEELLALTLTDRTRIQSFRDPELKVQLHQGVYFLNIRKPDEEVKLQFGEEKKCISEQTKFNEMDLMRMFNIETSEALAIENELGAKIYAFIDKEKEVVLNEGNYTTVILSRTSSVHQVRHVPDAMEVIDALPTILNIDE